MTSENKPCQYHGLAAPLPWLRVRVALRAVFVRVRCDVCRPALAHVDAVSSRIMGGTNQRLQRLPNPAALRRAWLMRDCQPGPVAR
jgi:hypothetical protein